MLRILLVIMFHLRFFNILQYVYWHLSLVLFHYAQQNISLQKNGQLFNPSSNFIVCWDPYFQNFFCNSLEQAESPSSSATSSLFSETLEAEKNESKYFYIDEITQNKFGSMLFHDPFLVKGMNLLWFSNCNKISWGFEWQKQTHHG